KPYRCVFKMGTTSNLLYGTPHYIKIGTYGASESEAIDVGFTDAALQLTPKFEIEKRMVAQNLGAVDANMKGASFTLKMTLAEASIENLKMALSVPDANVALGVLSIGAGLGVQKKTIYIEGPGPSGGNRKIKIQKCYLSEPGPYVMDKKSTNLDLTFELLEDTSVADPKQRFFVVTDVAV
ncbi:MAG TPA: hypothetical protein VHY08_21425, partial [Bacillota bacterium]|nr:hypothetical protein [Bacillota bacterium]